jgi:hypothetical protein
MSLFTAYFLIFASDWHNDASSYSSIWKKKKVTLQLQKQCNLPVFSASQ